MPSTDPKNLLHFDIIEVLGSGGNGTVYRALDTKTKQVVALKTLKNVSDATLTRFKREFLSLKRMNNSGIVKVYEGFFEHAPPFFSMEWVKGKTLSQVIQDMEHNPLVFNVADRENFALRLGAQVCDILSYIHGFEEVHRDLKPDNIFVTIDSGNILSEFTVKMLDFGLLKQVNESAKEPELEDSQSGMIVGTVHYLSPEQAKGGSIDPRSDLYGLGVNLYRIISLRLPYEANDVVGYIFKTVFEEPEPIEQHTPDSSAKMQALLADLLAKETSKRPPSAAALKRRIETILKPESQQFQDIQASDLMAFDSGLEGFGSPLLPPPLVGRDDAIHILETITDHADTGQPQAMILVGEPGMGRSSVIKEWKSRIQFKKPLFLQAHFSEEATPGQDPLGMLLDSLIRVMKPEEVKSAFRDVYMFLADTSRYLSRYFNTKTVGRFGHLSPSRKLQVLAVNVIKLIKRLEEQGPVCMILDDVQNAPERFFGWLTLFWEQLGPSRFVLVYSCSPDPSKVTSNQFRTRLLETEETQTMRLKPLEEAQIFDMLQSMLPVGAEVPFSDRLKKLITDRTRGNPFYAIELFSRLYEDEHVFLDKRTLDIQNESQVDVPLSIHQALLKKVSRLPKEASWMLRTVAVFGNSVDYAILQTCMQYPDETFLNNLMILLKVGVLNEEMEPVHKLSFNAPALQSTLYNEIAPQTRRTIHENGAKAIEEHLENDDVHALEQVAYHYANSANYVRAVKYAYLAGNAALETKDTEKAIYFYQLSLSMMDKMENKQAQNLVNLKLAEVHLDNDNPREALTNYNKCMEVTHLSKMERLRSIRGRMMCYQKMEMLEEAYHDARELAKIGANFSKRIQAETLVARGELAWLAEGLGTVFRRDLMRAKVIYDKLTDWRITAPFTQIISNEVKSARNALKELIQSKFEPTFPIFLQLSAIDYFMGNFKQAAKSLDLAKADTAGVGAATDPTLMLAQTLLKYKLQSTLAPDHSSEEYLAIAQRYIDRFGLGHHQHKILLVQLEHLLMNGHYAKAWEIASNLANDSFSLPKRYLDRQLFLCFAVRAAWENQERPPRGWLLNFQKLEPQENCSFILRTHWSLAKAAEALLPMSSTGHNALGWLKDSSRLLVKLKLKYYYRAILVKEIKICEKLRKDASEQIELKVKLDKAIGVNLPDN